MAILRILLASFTLVSASSESSMSESMVALKRTSLLREGLNTMVLRAREWLRTHGDTDPDQAGMDELRQTNPDAYAIVQALITKKSLGLLNPRHPNAFGGYTDAAGTPGTMSTKVVDDPVVPVAAMAAVSTETQHAASGSHQDFFSWKPHDDDDAMADQLQNGGAAPAELKEATQAQPEPQMEKHDAGMMAVKVANAKEIDVPNNPYMQSLTPATASMSQQASSVKVAKVVAGRHNALASFNWDDDDNAATAASVQHATAPASPTGNALEKFLS